MSRPSLSKQNSSGSITRESRRTRSGTYNLNGEEDVFQQGVLITSESYKSSRIPVTTASTASLRRCKTPDGSTRSRTLSGYRPPSAHDNYDSHHYGSSSARTPRSGSSLSRRNSRRSNRSVSTESLADSVYDDMKWQLGESDLDISVGIAF